ncbi:MAG: hypothetical protein ACRCX2_22565 [Paraclostridium sp.]
MDKVTILIVGVVILAVSLELVKLAIYKKEFDIFCKKSLDIIEYCEEILARSGNLRSNNKSDLDYVVSNFTYNDVLAFNCSDKARRTYIEAIHIIRKNRKVSDGITVIQKIIITSIWGLLIGFAIKEL